MDENFNNGYNNPQENNSQDYNQQYNNNQDYSQQYNQQDGQQNNQTYNQQYNQMYGQQNNQSYTQQNVYQEQQYGNPQQNGYNQNFPYQYGQPQQYNDPYYNAQYPEYRENNGKNGFAIAALVLGLVSIFSCCLSLVGCCFWLTALPASIVGLILGIVSLKKGEQGKGMAIAGIVTSALSLAYCILIIVIAIIYAVSHTAYSNSYDYF